MKPLSAKQIEVVQHCNNVGALCLSYGAVRSGKTFAACFGFFVYTQKTQPDYLHLITGRNKTVLAQEIVATLEMLARYFGLDFIYKHSIGELRIGKTRYIVSAGYDIKSEGRIRGLSIGSILFDEATLPPEEYWEQSIARMTYADSKLWATCNPEGNRHWLKRKWVDEEKFTTVSHLAFDDNPILSDTVKERNSNLFAGVFHDRMVIGQWTDASGVIYQNYHLEDVRFDKYQISEVDVGVDYGTSSVTTFVEIIKLRSGKRFVNRVFYHNAEKEGNQLTDDEVRDKLADFVKDYNRGVIWIDPSAASLKATLFKKPCRLVVRNADNDVLNGIRVVMAGLTAERLTINTLAPNESLRDEMIAYRWIDGEDKPVKEEDHTMDALRYAYYSRVKFSYGTGQIIQIPQGF